VNYQLSLSQGFLALQTFSMILTLNSKTQSTLEFSYFSGLLILIPTTVILSKLFLVDPTMIFSNGDNFSEEFDREKCITLIILSLFSTGLLLAWTLLFTTSTSSKLLLVALFFFSNIGEGMKLYLLNFSGKINITKLNISLIFTSLVLQHLFVSDFFYVVVLFYLQSLPFLIIFIQKSLSCENKKLKLDFVRLKETSLQSAEGVLSLLQLFIFMWILRTMSQTQELLNFQQSIILMTPLNSLANLLTIGLYSRLLISKQSLTRLVFKYFLITISLIYLVAVMLDPVGYVDFLINHGEVPVIKDWLVAQIAASCCSLYIVDKYLDLKARKLGSALLKARCFEVLLTSSIFFVLITTSNTQYLIVGFFIGTILGTCNWIRIYTNSTK